MSGEGVIRTTDLEQVWVSRPVDVAAALVTGPGVHWEPERPANWPARSYDAPPSLIRWRGAGDLRGIAYGRVTVLGLLRARRGWALWLVRCQCGALEDRTSKAITTQQGPMCWRCDRLVRMQTGQALEVEKRRKRYRPKDVAEVMLASREVRRASGMEPRTAMHAALSAALQRRTGG